LNRKVLFLDTVHPVLKKNLEKDGYVCEEDYSCTRRDLKEKLSQYFGLVIRSRFVLDKELLENASNLKFIARSGSGMENIDVAFAERSGIKCFNSPEGNRDAVGEHALGMLLSLLNKMVKGSREVSQGKWLREENRGVEIGGKTVGIIGYGNTGSAFAKKLRGFDCRILAYDLNKSKFGNEFVEEAEPETIFQESDIVSLHIPLNEKNHYFADVSFFHAFKKPIYFINTSRGEVLKTVDLVDALKHGKVLGACLDVLEYELKSFENLTFENLPPAFHYLSKADNVLLTPHIAGWTTESYIKLSSVLYDKIKGQFG
jgi:D-3-phosphoglycerate dehydrogenase